MAVHLAPGDTIGNRANLGCRLTQSEIQSYLLELEAFAKQKFGVGVDLQWNSPPQVFEDDFLLGRPVFRVQAFLDGVRYNDPGYTHSKLNIYFAGWILPQNPAHPQNSLRAFALDPTGWANSGNPNLILINDLDYGSQQPPGVNPYYTANYWIQCHEFCHYMLRRDHANPLDPEAEHWPATANLLMREGGIMPYPHSVHGSNTDRIRERLRLGWWNSPQLTSKDP